MPRLSDGSLRKFIAPSLLILYSTLLLFPRAGFAYGAGLDYSWAWALNVLPASDFAFGRDVAFTFGPLGYVTTGILAGPTGPHAALLRLFLHFSLAIALLLAAAQARLRSAIWIFVLCFVVACTLSFSKQYDLYYDYHLLFLTGLLSSLAVNNESGRTYTIYLAGFFAGLALFVKLNTGLAAAGMLALTGMALLWRRPGDWKRVVLSGLIYAFTVLLLAQCLLGSITYLPTWLHASYEIVQGYSAAMSLAGPRSALLRAVLTWAVYISLALWCARQKLRLGLTAILLLAPIFIAFKGGFVRQDGLAPFFFLTVPMMMTLFIVNARDTRELVASTTAFCLTLALATPTCMARWNALPSVRGELARIVTLRRSLEHIKPFFSLAAGEAEMDAKSRVNLQPDVLPDSFLAGIDKERDTVSVLPWELTYCPANQLHWNPTPTLQLYASYTSWLDNWNADHFDPARRPDWVIVHYGAIDGRQLLWDTPATWRALLGNYRVERSDARAQRLLLRSTQPRAVAELTTLGHAEASAHQWIDVPVSNAPLYVAIEPKRRLVARLRETLFRLPAVVVEVSYEDGRPGGGRVPPDVMSNGLLINQLPQDAQQLAALFECRPTARVTRFRITGPGSEQLASPIRLTWKRGPAPCRR